MPRKRNAPMRSPIGIFSPSATGRASIAIGSSAAPTASASTQKIKTPARARGHIRRMTIGRLLGFSAGLLDLNVVTVGLGVVLIDLDVDLRVRAQILHRLLDALVLELLVEVRLDLTIADEFLVRR